MVIIDETNADGSPSKAARSISPASEGAPTITPNTIPAAAPPPYAQASSRPEPVRPTPQPYRTIVVHVPHDSLAAHIDDSSLRAAFRFFWAWLVAILIISLAGMVFGSFNSVTIRYITFDKIFPTVRTYLAHLYATTPQVTCTTPVEIPHPTTTGLAAVTGRVFPIAYPPNLGQYT